jgi:ABC-type lipoprotein release transport system permease subunit
MYLTLSWRNIWRNKRRTLIAAASIFFAALLAVLMRSAQLGSYAYMIDSSAKLYSGYLQIQNKDYWENRSLDKSIILSDSALQSIRQVAHVTAVAPRLEGFALVSMDTITKPAQVIGIDPQLEDNLSGLKSRLTAGSYLTPDSSGILMAEGLAQMLKVHLGDSIVLFGQGFHGQMAAARLPLIGLVKLPFEEMNNGLLFLSLKNSQNFFSAPQRITSAAVMIQSIRFLDDVCSRLQGMIGPDQTLMTWDEMLPDLRQSIQLDNAGGLIMLGILYIVIAFGVFGTIMMMASERQKEFGILVAVGMRKRRLVAVTTIETILISIIGVASGILCSIPIVYYMHFHPIHITGEGARTFDQLGIEPIFNFSLDPSIYLGQALVVLMIALASALYPFLFIHRLQPQKALRA